MWFKNTSDNFQWCAAETDIKAKIDYISLEKNYRITLLEKMSKNISMITHWASLTGPYWQCSYVEQSSSVGHFLLSCKNTSFKAVISTGGYLRIHIWLEPSSGKGAWLNNFLTHNTIEFCHAVEDTDPACRIFPNKIPNLQRKTQYS